MAVCLDDPRWSDPNAPLTIDAHAHLFNATDLPIKEFVAKVAASQSSSMLRAVAELFGTILQEIGWVSAPIGSTELQQLGKLGPSLNSCAIPGGAISVDRARAYESAVQELKAAATKHAPIAARSIPAEGRLQEFMATTPSLHEVGATMILELPDSYTGPASQAPGLRPFQKTLASALDFVLEMFQYRYTSLALYMDSYSTAPQRRIDLVASALVDYDWWLCGSGTCVRTPLTQQIDVMAEIATLTRGRVHAYAPFCPLREVLHRKGPTQTWSSLDFVKDAVEVRGAIGVKLYPPMGFAPFDNAGVQKSDPSFWTQAPWLPPISKERDFGDQLDRALGDLYTWCLKRQVPILAHANASVGPRPAFERLALAPHWDAALSTYPGLRINFGHFGGGGPDAFDFLKRLTPTTGSSGARAFVDASYFNELLDNQLVLKATLEQLLATDASGASVLKDRLLYGSDWKMLVLEENSVNYLALFEELIAQLPSATIGSKGAKSLADAFFGRNAVEFLGLRKGDLTRQRLEAFYQKRGVREPPIWMSKVDALG